MLGLIALGAMAGSSLLSAGSSIAQGDAANEISKINASRYLEQARRSRMMTSVNLYRQDQYVNNVRGSQTAAIVKSGGMLDDPTSQEIFKDTDENAALDEWLIRFGGAIEASNYEQAASNARSEGRMAKSVGRTQAISTILGGAGDLFTGYKRLYPGKA